MTRFTVRAFTDVGFRRKRNEDAVLVAGWLCQTHDGSLVTMEFAPNPPFVCAVADGMGGHAGGDVASRTALSSIAQVYPAWRSAQDVASALEAANAQVRDVGAGADLGGLGTTVAGLCFLGDQLLAFNVGDSRIYAISGGVVEQISIDDSVFDSTGRPTNVITQSLGQGGSVRPHVLTLALQAGTYLMCSDGISGMMSPDGLAAAFQSPDRGESAARLIQTARDNGAEDNFSLILVDVQGGDDD